MTTSLVKGQKVDLTKASADSGNTLKKLSVALGWSEKPTQTSGFDYDLDASAFGLSSGKVFSQKHFVFFNNLASPEGAITHTGDNLTGAGEGDDETIVVDLDKVPDGIDKIVFAVTIYDAENRKQNFGQVENAFIRAYDDNSTELVKYELDMEAALETVVVFGELVKRDGSWIFSANSAGFPGGFAGLCKQYGVDV